MASSSSSSSFEYQQLGVLILPLTLVIYLGVSFWLVCYLFSFSLLTYVICGLGCYKAWEYFGGRSPQRIKPSASDDYTVTIIGSGFSGVEPYTI